MKVAVLSANLGNFDNPVDPGEQTVPYTFHRFTDENFPPITGLTPRLQYRIPKMFGWQMFPGYDYYIWLDSSMAFSHTGAIEWMLKHLGDNDMAFFKHPWRKTVKEEVEHIDDYLNRKKGTKSGQQYLIDRYKNGLHKESLAYTGDGKLYASPVFIYRDNDFVRSALEDWWSTQSRYFTCDQVSLTYALQGIRVSILPGNPFESEYVEVASPHQ